MSGSNRLDGGGDAAWRAALIERLASAPDRVEAAAARAADPADGEWNAVTVVPHSHIACGGFNSNLCGSGQNKRRGDSDTRNRRQTKQNGAYE